MGADTRRDPVDDSYDRLEVAVKGAGQSGLANGYFLAKQARQLHDPRSFGFDRHCVARPATRSHRDDHREGVGDCLESCLACARVRAKVRAKGSGGRSRRGGSATTSTPLIASSPSELLNHFELSGVAPKRSSKHSTSRLDGSRHVGQSDDRCVDRRRPGDRPVASYFAARSARCSRRCRCCRHRVRVQR